MEIKTIGIACDHAGFPMKQFVLQYLAKKGYKIKDFGTNSIESVDYPDFAHKLGQAIERHEVYPGIAICGTGEGMAITLNKYPNVRAGLAWNEEIAHLIRQHNDANVLVLPGRFISLMTAERILDNFFAVPFDGGRHERRIEKIPVHNCCKGQNPFF